MRQVCGKSAADLLQTLHHTERVCGKSAASLRQTCRRLFIILKEYAASLRQVCGKTNLHVKKMTVCGRSAADLRQVCRRSMRQAHFFPMGSDPSQQNELEFAGPDHKNIWKNVVIFKFNVLLMFSQNIE